MNCQQMQTKDLLMRDNGQEGNTRATGRAGNYVIASGIGDLCGVCSQSRLRMLVVSDVGRESMPVPSVRSVPVVMATILVVDISSMAQVKGAIADDGIKFQRSSEVENERSNERRSSYKVIPLRFPSSWNIGHRRD